MADADHLTPLLQQYLNIKKGYKDAILFFRMGDFYEMFYEDAVVASKILEIALTTRDKRLNDPVPMCGIPYHAVNSYIPKLIREGYKVAICEQVEDPALAKGIVRREVIRIITPGTVLDGNLLDSKENNFIISLYPDKKSTGFAFVDVSTGDFYMGELKGEIAGNPQYQADDLIARIAPKEILFPADISNKLISKDSGYQKFYINLYPAEMFEYENAFRILHEQIKEDSSHLSEIDTNGPSVNAAGALLAYITDTQKTSLQNITNVKVYRNELYMAINETAQRTLDLVKPSQSGQKKGTLFHLLDRTATAMGGRLLKLWILHPLLNISDINIRQEAVEELKEAYTQRCKLRELLGSIQDMERIISRITFKVANARDFIALNQCLKVIPEIKSLISNCSALLVRDVSGMSDDFKDLGDFISRAIIESPPLAITEGGIIKDGYSKDLDDLRQISREGKGFIARLEAKERQRSGIDSLKVRYNRVFGYYIEVTKANLKNVPPDYIRKQTLVNAERFITPELKDYESKVLGAEERIKGLEYKLFEEIREVAAHEVDKIQKSAKAIALIDVISTLAEIAHLNHYVRPVVDNSHSINIREGRHPVIEQMDLGERFVPNDIDMDCERNQLMILTGPNMAGKSTYMRQAALIVLMAQIGSFVPAREASIGVVDRIFTRIGASDNIAEGRSTFMVEMEETANILRNATSRSLILLDEIGRGTSTFDGISIAWSCAEYINRHIKAKTLFATHYHELTELALTNEGIFNAHMVVREWNDEVIFLRKVMPGMADKSYGIQVARLAGLPPEVIIRSKEVLANLEEEELDANGMPKLAHTAKEDRRITTQIDLFSHVNDSHPILDEIRELDLMNITP
ncbi:MAG: DNA mismatch repair protein MutS, partial [Nitrospirae bacterium RIFCSPLOW2_12_42_9]